jgi:hypothetical protein
MGSFARGSAGKSPGGVDSSFYLNETYGRSKGRWDWLRSSFSNRDFLSPAHSEGHADGVGSPRRSTRPSPRAAGWKPGSSGVSLTVELSRSSITSWGTIARGPRWISGIRAKHGYFLEEGEQRRLFDWPGG